jgi:hypothetical protein
MSLESDGGMILTGENRRTLRKTCPSATLSTTNPTWIDPGANPVLRDERLATNDLSQATALNVDLLTQLALNKSATAALREGDRVAAMLSHGGVESAAGSHASDAPITSDDPGHTPSSLTTEGKADCSLFY